MAKMHSKKKGKSKSRKPKEVSKPKEMNIPEDEVKNLVLELAKKGTKPSEIGHILRDEYGVGDARSILGKKLVRFLEEEKAAPEYPEDLLTLIKRAVSLREHLKRNKGDVHNKTKLIHTESKIMRLSAYYQKEGKLPKNWRYDPESAALLVR